MGQPGFRAAAVCPDQHAPARSPPPFRTESDTSARPQLIDHLLRNRGFLNDERVLLRRECASKMICPIGHQPASLLQQVPTTVGALGLIADQ